MINIDNLEKFITEELNDGENLSVRKEGWIDIIGRIRQSEKDAARYRWVRSASVTELSEFCNMIRPNRDSFVDDSLRRIGDNK